MRLDAESSPNQTSIDVIAAALEPVMPAASRLSSPDGALTLMLSDIADAEAMTARLGPESWDRLLRDHHVLVEQLLAHHDGQVVKFERDGFLASFNSAHGGLHAAVELQRALSGDLRIGMHAGFPIIGSDQLLGRNVVLAARIAALAQAGAILVSSTLKEYTESDPSFQFEFAGEHRFKGLLGDHTVYGVRWRA
ncbi:MAG: adenylate/guanylate cyclase domain-containing protein [Solirubrobacteraceae bacterium]